ncbi:hypothetical protein CBR_g39253 [Chara braunii]|uniref:RRM domain-containing protein n=1 Tax=Chara braunii TaxID=69332 RepID=A0A388K0W8_CHABU|nr:hypothetical protein CBR_g39253 [Chara braunii]|eukprot:GBG63711.1 hypothetical protein CBR_g39253 [Chara braunii]
MHIIKPLPSDKKPGLAARTAAGKDSKAKLVPAKEAATLANGSNKALVEEKAGDKGGSDAGLQDKKKPTEEAVAVVGGQKKMDVGVVAPMDTGGKDGKKKDDAKSGDEKGNQPAKTGHGDKDVRSEQKEKESKGEVGEMPAAGDGVGSAEEDVKQKTTDEKDGGEVKLQDDEKGVVEAAADVKDVAMDDPVGSQDLRDTKSHGENGEGDEQEPEGVRGDQEEKQKPTDVDSSGSKDCLSKTSDDGDAGGKEDTAEEGEKALGKVEGKTDEGDEEGKDDEAGMVTPETQEVEKEKQSGQDGKDEEAMKDDDEEKEDDEKKGLEKTPKEEENPASAHVEKDALPEEENVGIVRMEEDAKEDNRREIDVEEEGKQEEGLNRTEPGAQSGKEEGAVAMDMEAVPAVPSTGAQETQQAEEATGKEQSQSVEDGKLRKDNEDAKAGNGEEGDAKADAKAMDVDANSTAEQTTHDGQGISPAEVKMDAESEKAKGAEGEQSTTAEEVSCAEKSPLPNSALAGAQVGAPKAPSSESSKAVATKMENGVVPEVQKTTTMATTKVEREDDDERKQTSVVSSTQRGTENGMKAEKATGVVSNSSAVETKAGVLPAEKPTVEVKQDPLAAEKVDDELGVGKVFVEFTREESARKAAHALQGRLYGGRKVSVAYFPLELYQKQFRKGLPTRPLEERQMLYHAVQRYLTSPVPE